MANQASNELRVCGICQKPISPNEQAQAHQLPDGMGLYMSFHSACVDAFRQVLVQSQLLEEVANPVPSGDVKHVDVGQVQAQKASKRCSLCNQPTTSKYGVHDECMARAYPDGRQSPHGR